MDSPATKSDKTARPVAVAIALDGRGLSVWVSSEYQWLGKIDVILRSRVDLAYAPKVVEAIAKADVLFVLFSSKEVKDSTARFLDALSQVSRSRRLAILRVDTDNLPDVGKALEEIISGLDSGAIEPVRAVAAELQEAIMTAGATGATDAAGSPSPAQEQQTNAAPAAQTVSQGPASAEDEGPPAWLRFDQLRREDFSELAWQMLEVARKLGQGRERPQASARRLLTSMVLSGSRRKGDDRTGSWLVSLIELEPDAIRTRIYDRYPVVKRHRASFDAILRSDIPLSEGMTQEFQDILQTAKVLAAEARPGAPVVVGARHLLGAAVRYNEHDSSIKRTFGDFGLNVDDVRSQLIGQLSRWGLDDDQDAWSRVLEPSNAPAERRLPTYAADSAVGPDLIGITREVEAMASLVSAWSVEPPLSIGLFGEWGSGKSFFMQKMKERVRQIAIEARKSKRPQRDFGYYKNIVQVEFNAWHYVEGNLWASLVEHIFANLRFEGTDEEKLDSEENINKRLEKMLEQFRDKTAEANAKDEQASRLTATADTAQRTADETARLAATAKAEADKADRDSAQATHEAVQKHADAQNISDERRTLLLKDVAEEVQFSPEVRADIEAGLAQLGITRERLQTVQGFRDALKEATEAGTVIAQGLALLRQSQGWLLLLWVFAVPAAIVLLGFVFGYLASLSGAGWMQGIATTGSVLLSVMTGAIASWKKLSPRLRPLIDVFNAMKSKRAELEIRVEEERQRRAVAAAKLDVEVLAKQREADQKQRDAAQKAAEALKARQEAENLRASAAQAEKEAAEARAASEKLKNEADALRPERRIATFIQDRAAATDYRRHLGVPALIRRDFEKLSAMFETQRRAEEKGDDCRNATDQNDPTVVNRIILYIDDLDRCPPEKVVEVLRAIHLLLAFRLFVVVVAVDARWMKRSLKDRFSLMLSAVEGRPATGNGDGTARSSEADPLAGSAPASPDDYLEKIFQVPFWIRPLGRSGSRRLVGELTRHDVDPLSVASSANPETSGKSAPVPAPERKGSQSVENVETRNMTDSKPVVQSASEQSSSEAGSRPQSEWSVIEPKPRTLMLTADEREYMMALSLVIGRSPRSVKRFVNCYRLLKSTLDAADLDRAARSGTFRTAMLLLGVVTGFPEAAPALLADLRDAPRNQAPEAWARAAATRLNMEERGKWADLLPIIGRLNQWGVLSVGPLADAAALVDRFSFSPVQRPVETLVARRSV